MNLQHWFKALISYQTVWFTIEINNTYSQEAAAHMEPCWLGTPVSTTNQRYIVDVQDASLIDKTHKRVYVSTN